MLACRVFALVFSLQTATILWEGYYQFGGGTRLSEGTDRLVFGHVVEELYETCMSMVCAFIASKQMQRKTSS